MSLHGESEEELISMDDVAIEDEAEDDETVAPVRYETTSYGIDFDVEGVVRRIKRDDIFIPEFQRSFIWNLGEASRFIESLLLGLPVPGIFLSQEPESGRLLVIDGQQRLKTLLFFYTGIFNPLPQEKTRRIFKLTNVQREFTQLTYEDLKGRDRLNLDNSVIHATVVKQDAPPDDDTSMYHIFDRLNRGGRRLYPQEMRGALYHGALIDTLKTLNQHPSWRRIFGKVNPRLKDQDMILRLVALYFAPQDYKRPMSEYLNIFGRRHRNPKEEFLQKASQVFTQTIGAFDGALGRRSFRLRQGGAFNAAIFDSMGVGLARRLRTSTPPPAARIKEAYDDLLSMPDYLESVSRSTADEGFVTLRLDKATKRFAEL